ncbi:MAG: hypothetical protein LBS02_10955 [Hungatella sp.]|jgi:hypothetical protein|nr:hypothetical protein [Hungatella sp.]
MSSVLLPLVIDLQIKVKPVADILETLKDIAAPAFEPMAVKCTDGFPTKGVLNVTDAVPVFAVTITVPVS